MWIPAVPDSRQWMCGIGVQDVHPGQKDSSKQQPHSAKPIPLLGRKDQQQQLCQPLGSVPVLAMQYFFCFLLKICESASSLSCPCRLTERKCVFVHILAFPSWVLHHLILDFFFPHCSYYFLFQAFSDVLALSYFHGFIPHSQTVLDNALGLVLHWETHPGPAGSIPSPSVSIKEKHLRCSSRALLEKIPLSSRQTTRTGVRTSKM